MLESVRGLEMTSGLSISRGPAVCSGPVRQWLSVVGALLLLMLGALATNLLATSVTGERSANSLGARSHGFLREGLLSLPPAARGPVSAAVGAEGQAYRVRRSGFELAASGPAQHLSMRFARSGVSVHSGTTQVGLSLLAVGYGSALARVGQVSPTARANRVLYRHSGLSEWYANGPLGLEQGFTIPRAPDARHGRPVDALAGALGQRARLARHGRAERHRSAARAAIAALQRPHRHRRAGRVRCTAGFELHAGRLLLRVDARGARYPLRIDPFIQQGAKLTGRRRESATRRIRLQRGAVRRRQHRADRRPERQQRRRRGVGVHALGLDLDPAGPEAHRQRRESAKGDSATAWRCPPTATPR